MSLLIYALKIISGVISSLLFIILVILAFRLRRIIQGSVQDLTKSASAPVLPKKEINKNWQAVLDKLDKGDESSCKMAVVEADKILDDILKRIGYQGGDMGERLKQLTPAQLANLNDIWEAHKIRNRIVHESGFRLSQEQAQKAIKAYERGLKDLEAL